MASGFDPDQAAVQDGDITVTYDWFQPQSINLAMGANLYYNRDTKSILSSFISAMASASNTLVDQPLMSGIKKMFGFGDLVGGMMEIFKGAPASFVPTLLNQVKSLGDNTARNTEDPEAFNEVLNKMVAKIPYAAGTLEPQVTVWGEDKKYGPHLGPVGRFFETFISPAYSSKVKVTPESKMAIDLWLGSGLKTHLPRVADRKQNIITKEGRHIRKELMPVEYSEFQRYIGHKTGVLYSKLVKSDKFQAAPEDEQVKLISKYLSDITTSARVLYLGHRPSRISPDAVGLVVSGKDTEIVKNAVRRINAERKKRKGN